MSDDEAVVRGRTDVPLIEQSIGAYFDGVVARWCDREALVWCGQDVRWTYGEFGERVDACAAGLLALGLDPGDRVGLWSANSADWVVVQLATAKAGLVLVPANPSSPPAELEYVLNRAGCRALITPQAFSHGEDPGDLRWVIHMGPDEAPGAMTFSDILAKGDDRQRLEQVAATIRPGDPVSIQFTSGTTGGPKGATLSHRNMLNNGFFIGEAMGFSEVDRLCIPVALFHCFGMVASNMAAMTHGATMVYPAPAEGGRFDPIAVLGAVEAERCTALNGVPLMFKRELEHVDFGRFDLQSLRTGVIGGALCPMELMQHIVDDMHIVEITNAFGMTETSPCTFQTAGNDPVERRVDSVGRVGPHVEAKVIDSAGTTVPAGDKGELCIRGYPVMLGYWNDEAQTRATIDSEGWLHTGDAVTIDADGFCRVAGRLKEMVNRAGENIFPRDVEDVLRGFAKIDEAQVFGIPDESYGEELCAWIILADGEAATVQEIIAFCRSRIAKGKIPRHIKFVHEFPTTTTGKVQTFVMREAMVRKLEEAD